MYLLDTNIYQFSIDGLYGVNEKLLTIPPEEIYLSGIVLYEVIINGWMKELDRIDTSKSVQKREEVYQSMIDDIGYLSQFQIRPYSDEAEIKYREIHKKVKRSRCDCKIAAQAILAQMTVVTDNTTDFQEIKDHFPELRFENWADRSS